MCIEKKTESFNSGVLKNFFRNICSSPSFFRDIQDAIPLIFHSIPKDFFECLYHAGCAINVKSIINSGLIFGGQSLRNRQTVFFLFVDPMDKNHKDPEKNDLSVPRGAKYVHSAWKKHQYAVFWVDIILSNRKGLKFHQTRSDAIILQGILPAYCIPKVVRLKTGEVLNEKTYMSPRPPPKISLKHEWKRELGSEHAQRSHVGQQSRSL